MAKQDKKNISANNPDEPKDVLGSEAALVGNGKNTLVFGKYKLVFGQSKLVFGKY